MTDWEYDCRHWLGRVLTGKYAHWCEQYNNLPMDETCFTWPCKCLPELEQELLAREQKRAGAAQLVRE